MRANVYVDGFNLYYGALKGTRLLPRDTIHRIRYFTARVSARPEDPGQAQRQQLYLRALATLPRVSIHWGHFLTHRVRMPLAPAPPACAKVQLPLQFVWVWRTEEKGSDVKLATNLLYDAFRNDYDVAVVLSNDSDLSEPIRLVRHELGKSVGVFSPYQQHPSQELERLATFFKRLRRGVLAASQLPDQMRDAQGAFHKPPSW